MDEVDDFPVQDEGYLEKERRIQEKMRHIPNVRLDKYSDRPEQAGARYDQDENYENTEQTINYDKVDET